MLKVWDGLSSMGGLLGGIVAAVVFFRARGLPIARYADSLALGIAPGWAIAHLGCFSVHDHPGTLTNFFLAVQFPGGARHDLGLYDAPVLFALTLLVYGLASRRLLTGRLLAVLALGYGTARFVLDFLRAADIAYADARYLGFTPAQYVSVFVALYGAAQLVRRHRSRNGEDEDRSMMPAQPLVYARDRFEQQGRLSRRQARPRENLLMRPHLSALSRPLHAAEPVNDNETPFDRIY